MGNDISFWSRFILITIKCDVGFGNALFITGEKSGEWQRAHRLHWVDGNEWSIHLHKADFANGAKFKFLIGPYSAGAITDITSEFTYERRCDRQINIANPMEHYDELSLNDFPDYSHHEASRRLG